MPPHAPGSPAQPTDPDHEAGSDRPKPFFAHLRDDGTPDPTAEPAPPPAAGPRYGESAHRNPGYGPPQVSATDRREPPDQGQNGERQPGAWPPANKAAQRQSVQRRLGVPGRELRQRAIAALVFGGVSLIALLGLSTDLRKGVYVLGFSALIGLSACVIGITALVKARKTGSYRPRGAVPGIVLGFLGMLVSVPILLTYLTFPTQLTNYVNCLSQAQNATAQKACMTKFYKSIGLDSGALQTSKPVKP